MPYKVHKLIPDKRNHTCGFMIPNGGFYWVLEMTFENHTQLTHIGQRPGYSVDYVEGKLGFFDGDGYEVDPGSVERHKITKEVANYKRVTRTYRGKEVSKQEIHIGTEREKTLREARSIGVRFSEISSTQTIKDLVSSQGQRAQSSLTSTLA